MTIEDKTLTYIRSAKHTLLSSNREKEIGLILNEYATGKKRESAINELITHNLYLVIKIAFKYSKKTGRPLDDFIGAGNLGLARAARTFDPIKFNNRFSTYAIYWIIMEILKLIKKSSGPVTVPLYVLDLHNKYRKLIEDGPVSDEELMSELKINSTNLSRIKLANTYSVSLDEPLPKQDGHLSKELYLKNSLEDISSRSPAEKMEEDGEFAILYAAINELDDMSKEVVLSRYLSDDKIQLEVIGKKFNMSSERVRQISKSALDKLRKKILLKRKNVMKGK
jgi:RNA polymerase sigma factor (sigma-70 family)